MIKWNKTTDIEPPLNTVFIGCRCKNSDFLSLNKEYKLEDCFPMIKIDKDYRFAVKSYPFTTEIGD